MTMQERTTDATADVLISFRVSPDVKRRIEGWGVNAGLPTAGDAYRIVLELGLRRMNGRRIVGHANPLIGSD